MGTFNIIFLQFLHENGLLLHYDDATLRDLYFLDPQVVLVLNVDIYIEITTIILSETYELKT